MTLFMKNLICLLIIGLSFFPVISQNRVDKSEIEIIRKRIVAYKTDNRTYYLKGYIYLLDGKKYNGVYFANYENGNLMVEFEVKNGLRVDGTRRTFDSIGNVKMDETQIGEYITNYHENGQIWIKETILSTEREGQRMTITESYWGNGKLQSIKTYKDGRPHGCESHYDKTGRLIVEYNFKNGDRHGFEIHYPQYGETTKELWKNGRLVLENL